MSHEPSIKRINNEGKEVLYFPFNFFKINTKSTKWMENNRMKSQKTTKKQNDFKQFMKDLTKAVNRYDYSEDDIYDHQSVNWKHMKHMKLNCPDVKGMTTESAQAKKIEQLTDVIAQQQLWLSKYAEKLVELEEANKNSSDWNNRLWQERNNYRELEEKHQKASRYIAKLKEQHEKEIATLQIQHILQHIQQKHDLEMDIPDITKQLVEFSDTPIWVRMKHPRIKNQEHYRIYKSGDWIYTDFKDFQDLTGHEKFNWRTI